MKKIIVIPARLSSTRLPNKVLLDLNGKTILQRVYEQCMKVCGVDVFIATDSLKVKKSCSGYTQNVIMTSVEHKSGTDRIIEAIEGLDFEAVINVQGDEPFISPLLIEKLFRELEAEKVKVVTACERLLTFEELFNPNVVKVVKDNENNALYFSRSCIPHIIDNSQLLIDEKKFFKSAIFFKHVGIYGYKKHFLTKYSSLENSNLEKLEMLEQLRILESGFKIKILETKFKSVGIDSEDDYQKALKMIEHDI
ncbi:3-deoxy-manno-octulosonate cytidylyltransferase [Flavobacteriaceae bacterium]|nr:3-deoxy-manno-octulosonate cytidylyltransferase [Flavobacteriaceae bacterium]